MRLLNGIFRSIAKKLKKNNSRLHLSIYLIPDPSVVEQLNIFILLINKNDSNFPHSFHDKFSSISADLTWNILSTALVSAAGTVLHT